MDPARDRGTRAGAALSATRRRSRREARSWRRRRRWLEPPRKLRPTRAGWIFFVLTFGVGFAALNTGNNLLYLVLSLMLAFLVLSGVLSEAALRGIRVERIWPREVFAGIDNRIGLRVHNRQPRVPAFAIVVEDRAFVDADAHAPGDPHEALGRGFALRIGPQAHALCHYRFAPARRGRLRAAGFRVSTRFPFGLFVKSLWLDGPGDLLVYPEVVALAVPESRGRLQPTGDSASGARGHGAEVSGLREYVPGDAARRIHWRSSLRRGALLVGEVDDADEAEIEVLLRTRTPARVDAGVHGDFERRVSWAASEVVSHLERGLRVSLRTDGERLPAGSGPAHRARLLDFLALVAPESAAGEASGALPGPEPPRDPHDAEHSA